MTVVGEVTSTPDADGNHRLKCPKCSAEFLAPITKDDETEELHYIACAACGNSDAPLAFLHMANKEIADKMVMDYAGREIRNILKRSFHRSKNIRFK